MTATWRFELEVIPSTYGPPYEPIRADQYAIVLSDAVTDVEGNSLDGDWTNPVSLSTVNAQVSTFPSGDGTAGGDLNFVFTLLAGDPSRDNSISPADQSIWSSHVNDPAFDVGAQFADGDMDGDGDVDQTDYDLGFANYPANLQSVDLLGNLNGDWVVDDTDRDILWDNRNLSSPTQADGDLNQDGDIDIDDLDLMFAQLGLELEVVS